MPKEFIIRGSTNTGEENRIELAGVSRGYGVQLTEFSIYPSNNIATVHQEAMASITRTLAGQDPVAPDFDDDALIGSAFFATQAGGTSDANPVAMTSVINDLAIITQDCLIKVTNHNSGGEAGYVNWQVKFREVKLSGAAEAVANYKQYTLQTA